MNITRNRRGTPRPAVAMILFAAAAIALPLAALCPVARAAPPKEITAADDVPQAAIQPRAEVPASGKGLVISGVVTDPEGKPVADAEVRSRGETRLVARNVRTDAQGRFEIGGLPSAEGRTVIVRHAGRNLVGRVEVPAFEGDDPPAMRSVQANVALQPAGRVVGQVTDGTRPLAGMGVSVSAKEEVRQGNRRLPRQIPTGQAMTTDADGRFAFDAVEPGRSLRLDFRQEGLANGRRVVVEQHCEYGPGDEFEVTAGKTFEHPLVTLLPLDQTVSGVVVDGAGQSGQSQWACFHCKRPEGHASSPSCGSMLPIVAQLLSG